MDILGFYHELLALIEDNDCEGLKAAKFNRTPGILYKPIEFEYLYDTDNEEPETDKSPEYEALEWIKEVCYAYQRNS